MGVAQQLLDGDEFDALFQEQGRGRVPEVVEADLAEAGPAEKCVEVAGESGGSDGVAVGASEDVAAVHSTRAGFLLLVGLLLAVGAEREQAGGRVGDAAFGADYLGGEVGQATGAGALEGAAEAGGSAGQVEVFPVQAEEFTLAESGVQGEFVQGVKAVAAGRMRSCRVSGAVGAGSVSAGAQWS
ncbi:hypothetical protein VM95_05280 [Streptomyces rubellomurinus]|uniref:Uncharacterized protein n=1 Tax=Streptomyces rubellomurinus (strain ATCC 31215) TaxID=359131 RepID=A0A0F2TIY3_STRR3|nr:hypothetical protein VM95_05280 [Streptomyces rubellomurinus]